MSKIPVINCFRAIICGPKIGQRKFVDLDGLGLIYGSQNFVADLKDRFLDGKRDAELVQRNRLFRPIDPQHLLNRASDVLGFDLEAARKAKRISSGEKENRDILIYLLWKRGGLSNQEIGALLGVTYSMVSKVVSTFEDRVQAESNVRAKIKNLNSQFKV